MNFSFLLIEALTIVGVPAVIAVCLMHIIDEARKERARRNAELSNLRAEIEKQLRKPTEDWQKTIGEMEVFTRRVKSVRVSPQQSLEALATRRELGAFGYSGTRTSQFRSSFKPRVSPKEWRQ
jgi:hypothetical protein